MVRTESNNLAAGIERPTTNLEGRRASHQRNPDSSEEEVALFAPHLAHDSEAAE